MANPFPFVSQSVLTAAELNGIGETAIAFTPTITNFTVGNGSSSFAFTRINKLVFVKGTITFGSTSSFSGFPIFAFPVTASAQYANQNFIGNAFILDSGTAAFAGVISSESTTTWSVGPYNVSSTFATYNAINATTPMTWTTNDSLRLTFIYEAA